MTGMMGIPSMMTLTARNKRHSNAPSLAQPPQKLRRGSTASSVHSLQSIGGALVEPLSARSSGTVAELGQNGMDTLCCGRKDVKEGEERGQGIRKEQET